jgi:hypothetical protein
VSTLAAVLHLSENLVMRVLMCIYLLNYSDRYERSYKNTTH